MSNLTSEPNKFLIVIAGPTGVGKTDLAIRLAQWYGAHIFSADSRQIYKEMNIGTAKPGSDILAAIPHYFINHVSIFETYSAGHFETDAKKLLASYFESNHIGILVGGTGLYIKALLHGLDDFPEIESKTIHDLETQYEEYGITWLQEQLLELDPSYYHTVDLNNSRRIIRALSIIKQSNKTYTSYLEAKSKTSLPYEIIEIGLEMPRDILYDRINKRVDEMFSLGLMEEARLLYPHREQRPLETVGYQELFRFFDHEISESQAVELIKQNSRRYAKRQISWFKKYGQWVYFSPNNFENVLDFVKGRIRIS